MSNLRKKIIRLAYHNPELRRDLLPLLRKSETPQVQKEASFNPMELHTILQTLSHGEYVAPFHTFQEKNKWVFADQQGHPLKVNLKGRPSDRFSVSNERAAKRIVSMLNQHFRRQRQKRLDSLLEGVDAMLPPLRSRRAFQCPNPIQKRSSVIDQIGVGDFFVSSWGYNQTNVDFYQVVGKTRTMVKLRRVKSKVVGSRGGSTEYVLPEPNKFNGPVIRKKLKSGYRGQPWIDLTSYSGASKWDGSKQSQTGQSWGH